MLSVFVLSTAAFAQSYSYDTTIPFFGHKTITEGTKYTSQNKTVNYTGNCESAFYCWIDCQINGSWTKVADDYTCYANATYEFNYDDVVPAINSSVRLRTKLYKTNSGQRIVGNIDFY